nr:hypothetical protein HMPREF0276_1699 [Corynebacterium accolens ATCC 49725]
MAVARRRVIGRFRIEIKRRPPINRKYSKRAFLVSGMPYRCSSTSLLGGGHRGDC